MTPDRNKAVQDFCVGLMLLGLAGIIFSVLLGGC